jgi:hypothetical protein
MLKSMMLCQRIQPQQASGNRAESATSLELKGTLAMRFNIREPAYSVLGEELFKTYQYWDCACEKREMLRLAVS